MTDKEKLAWLKAQLYSLQDYVSEQSGETVEDTDIDSCLWRIVNGYDLFGANYSDPERVAVEW